MVMKISAALLLVAVVWVAQASADENTKASNQAAATNVAPYYQWKPDTNFYRKWTTNPSLSPYSVQKFQPVAPSVTPLVTFPANKPPKPYTSSNPRSIDWPK